MRNSYQQLKESPSASSHAASSYNNLPIDVRAHIMSYVRLKDAYAYLMADKESYAIFRDYSVLLKLINMHQSSASLDRLSALASTRLQGDKIEENLELFLRLVSRIWCARMREQNHHYSRLVNTYLDHLSDSVDRLSVEGKSLEATIKQFNGCLKAQYAAVLFAIGDKIIYPFLFMCLVIMGSLLFGLIGFASSLTEQDQKIWEKVFLVELAAVSFTAVNVYQYLRCRDGVINALVAEQESEMVLSRNSLVGLYSRRAVEQSFCDVVRELGETKMDQVEALRLS